MKNKYLSMLCLLLVICMMLGGCVGGGEAEESGTQGASDTTDATQPSKEITESEVNGVPLSSLIVVTDELSDIVGELLSTAIKAGTGVSRILKCSVEDFERYYKTQPHIRLVTLPAEGENYSVGKEQVQFVEEDGNFKIIIGSAGIMPTDIVKYFTNEFLDFCQDLTGYNEMVKIGQNATYAAAIGKYDQKKSDILSAKSGYTASDVTGSGKCYYVSFSEGNDANDGLSEAKPWKTIAKLNATSLSTGSVVLFKRGDEWRLDDYSNADSACWLKYKSGVIYSAYGTGAKPVLKGSPFNAAEHGTWSETGTKNVWAYSEVFNNMPNKDYNDVGNILFVNAGEVVACGRKMITNWDAMPDFGGTLGELKNNLEFYFEPTSCKLYLYYDGGNPAEAFDCIEVAVRLNISRVHNASNVVIDNLAFKYGGAHAIATAGASNIKITNCVISWIGGGVFTYGSTASSVVAKNLARYGNGVEINVNSNNVTVENNYVYQIYDAGFTHQHDSTSTAVCRLTDISYHGNVIEKCQYAIEMFLATPNAKGSYMDNIDIRDNVLIYSGYGWGYSDRYDWDGRWGSGEATHLKGTVSSDVADKGSVIIENNVMLLSKHDVIYLADKTVWDKVPEVKNNIIIQQEGARGISLTDPTKTPIYDRPDFDAKALSEDVNLKGKGNTFVTLK